VAFTGVNTLPFSPRSPPRNRVVAHGDGCLTSPERGRNAGIAHADHPMEGVGWATDPPSMPHPAGTPGRAFPGARGAGVGFIGRRATLRFMKALLLSSPGSLAWTDVEAPVPGAGEVRVRVAACGICGSDVHGYTGSTGRRIPPLVMGHEAAGAVDAVGAGVDDLPIGTRVALDSTVFCGGCDHCRAGRENLCTDRQVLGVSCGQYRRHGCFAEQVVVPRRVAYPIPDSLDFVAASLLEPLTIALHAVHLGGVGPNTRSAVVVGAGPIGLACVAALRAYGVPRIAAIDLDEGRLAQARLLGATETIPAGDEAGRTAARWGTTSADTDGADVVLEAVGATAPVRTAIESCTRGGTVVLVGNVSPSIEMPLQLVVTRQIRLQGSCSSAGCYPEAIRLVSEGKIDLSSFVSRVAPLAEGPEWFRRLHDREPGLVKVVLRP
jgi:L-iditol 2-dehydrogenase